MQSDSATTDRSDNPGSARSRRWRRPPLAATLLLVAALICIGIGGKMLVMRFVATHHATVPNTHQTITITTDHPSEARVTPKQADTYVVPPNQPRSITLPSIKASGLIQKVGLTKDNALAAPTSIYFAGWYTGGAKPGDKGLSIIDGHVSGWYNDGIFKHLLDLSTGDIFSVEYGDKSVRKFQVVSVAHVPVNKAADLLFQHLSTISRQLNLITCGGKFNNKTQEFEERVIVTSKRIS